MPRPRTFFFYKHQRKADAFEVALLKAGWIVDRSLYRVAASFFDADILQRRELFESLHDHGLKMFLYPHASRPNIFYAWKDTKPHRWTSAQFVVTEAHAEVMRRIGYPHPIHPVGWSYCEQKPFQPVEKVRNVLFGPTHPNANGWMSEEDKEINRRALARLKKSSMEMDFHITIRYIHSLVENGLAAEEDHEITYVKGKTDNSFADIDHSDVVVGHETFADIAVARGKPTLKMDEWVAPRIGNSPETFSYIRDWDKIKDLMMYPLDINTAPDVNALIKRASETDEDIVEWRENMIGKPFDGDLFASIVDSYFPEIMKPRARYASSLREAHQTR